jgi:hypothetical protein
VEVPARGVLDVGLLVVGLPAEAGWFVVLICVLLPWNPVDTSGKPRPTRRTVGDSTHSRQVLEIPDSLRRCEPDQV